MSKRTIVAFIHSYMPDGRLDPFMQGIVDAFISCGVNVHLIKANDLVISLGAKHYAPYISQPKVDSYVRDLNPDFIFTSNRCGICKSLIENPPCPIMNWFVDLIPFSHHGADTVDFYGPQDHVITSSSKNVPLVERDHPELKGRVHYLPFTTSTEDFNAQHFDAKDIPISFVGTFFYSVPIKTICGHFGQDKELYKRTLGMISAFEEDFDRDPEATVEKFGMTEALAKHYLLPVDIKAAVTNAVSANNRAAALDAVSDLGLHLYGTENWIDAHTFSLSLFHCYKPWAKIDTREKLVEIYQRSKISINVSHMQAIGGLPYRIFDIMASDSMLLVDEESRHDMELLFGDECPVPFFKSPADAHKLAKHYLENEEERLDIVKKCQALVSKGFHFSDRVKSIFDLAGLPLESTKEHGTLTLVPQSEFNPIWTNDAIQYRLPKIKTLVHRAANAVLGEKRVNTLKNRILNGPKKTSRKA